MCVSPLQIMFEGCAVVVCIFVVVGDDHDFDHGDDDVRIRDTKDDTIDREGMICLMIS